MLLHDLPIKINEIIENSKNFGELKNTKVTIEIKEKDSSSLFGEVYNIHEISNYFRFIEPNYYSVGIINKIEIDYELKELFIKRLRNRLNIYNSNNKEVVSGFRIQENKNSKSKIENFDIVGSV